MTSRRSAALAGQPAWYERPADHHRIAGSGKPVAVPLRESTKVMSRK
jgi:hypothetical protein